MHSGKYSSRHLSIFISLKNYNLSLNLHNLKILNSKFFFKLLTVQDVKLFYVKYLFP